MADLRPIGAEFRLVTFHQNTTNPGRWAAVYRVVEHVPAMTGSGDEELGERVEVVEQVFTPGILWRDYCCDGLEKFAEMKDGRITFQHAKEQKACGSPA